MSIFSKNDGSKQCYFYVIMYFTGNAFHFVQVSTTAFHTMQLYIHKNRSNKSEFDVCYIGVDEKRAFLLLFMYVTLLVRVKGGCVTVVS